MTARSRIFESNGRLEMGLKLSRMSGLRPGFFSRGVMVASLSGDGTEPVAREEFMMVVMNGMSTEMQVLSSGDGMGSR